VQLVFTQMPDSHVSPVGQLPQSRVLKQPVPITPQ